MAEPRREPRLFTTDDLDRILQQTAPGMPQQEEVPPVPVDTSSTFTTKNLEGLGYQPTAEEKTPVTLSSSELAETYATGAAAKGIPMLVGTTAGARAGFLAGAPLVPAATPLMGPAAAAIPLITAAGGAVLGYQGTKALADSIVDEPVLGDPRYAAYEAGGTLGETLGMIPLMFSAPQALAPFFGPRVAGWLTAVSEGARKYPKSTILGETTGGLSSSVGTYVAETKRPGDATSRFLYEVGFGLADPAKLFPFVTSKGFDVLKTAYSLRNKAGREAYAASRSERDLDKATMRLIEIYQRHGEDIPELIKQLEAPLPGAPGVTYQTGKGATKTGPTAAQKTGSLVLAQLETALSTLNPQYGADVSEQGKQALTAYSLLMQRLNEVGSPKAFRAAATMQRDLIKNAINVRFTKAMDNVREKVKVFEGRRDTPEIRTQIGRIIKEEVINAEKDAREVERILWTNAMEDALTPRGTKRVSVMIPTSRELNEAYNKRAQEVLQDMVALQRRYGKVDFNNARQVSRLTGQKAKSFTQYLKEKTGGIVLDSEWMARDLNGRTRPGLFLANTPANRSRAGMDALREAAFDGGYFTGKRSYRDITDDEIFDAVEADTPTSRFWQADVRERLADAQSEADYLMQMRDELDLRPDMTAQQIAARLRAVDETRLNQGRDDLFVPVGKQRMLTRTVNVPNVLAPNNLVSAALNRLDEIDPTQVPKVVPPDVLSFFNEIGLTKDVIDRYRKGRDAGESVERLLPRAGAIKEIPVRRMINLRSNFLELAREAYGSGQAANANFYSLMAQNILKDLSTLPGEKYDIARTYSNAFNDKFTRTFANKLLQTTQQGGDAIPVETLISNSFGAGADRVSLRLLEIENAVGFLKQQLDDDIVEGLANPDQIARVRDLAKISGERASSIDKAQKDVLMLLASKATYVDPKTDQLRVNPRQLTQFVTQYDDLLTTMGLKDDLLNVNRAENALAGVLNANSRINRDIRNKSVLPKILGYESLTKAIGDVLSPNSKNPTRGMRELSLLAKKTGQEAVDGLRSGIYDHAWISATGGRSDVFNPQAYYDFFFKKRAADQPAVADILKNAGIMKPDELNNLRTLTNQMRTIEDAMANRRTLENVMQGSEVMGELVMRVAGSKIGTAASGGGPGALIAASAGSKAIRDIFDKMPMVMVRKIIEDATQNPEFMAQLLKRGLSERERLLYARRLHSYLVASGLNYAGYDAPPEGAGPGSRPGAPRMQESEMRRILNNPQNRPRPPAPTTRGMPGLPSGGGGPPPAGGGAPPTSQSRMMLQQLFPNDPITGAAAMQAGIPPMPG